MTIRWSETSANDLASIFEFYESKSMDAAQKVTAEIIEEVEQIKFPDQYQKDDLNPLYRRIIVSHFKVLYRVQNDAVLITRIFDTRQNPAMQKR